MTAFQFQPNTTSVYSFQPTLDGQPYHATVTWNTWGQRWWLNIVSLSGTLVVSRAVVSSANPVSTPLTTTAGLYTASVIPLPAPALLLPRWAVDSVNVPAGTMLSAVTPSGVVRLSEPASATGTDPNAAFGFFVDMLFGLGFGSTMAFYASSQQFVVSP